MRCWACERENAPGVRFCASCGAGLRCADCGAPFSGGQRFCTNCGRRVPVRGAQTAVQRVEHRSEATEHFRIHYMTGSFAEQSLAAVGTRLEAAHAAATSLLALDPRAVVPIDV